MTIVPYTAVAGDVVSRRSGMQCFRSESIFQRPVMEAKRYKVLPHLFFPHDDVTIWIDGNITLTETPATIVDELLGDADIAAFKHPYRETVWQEFDILKQDPRFDIPYLQRQRTEQWRAYWEEGLPSDAPLFECNVLIRRNSDRVRRLSEAWWAQICRWQWRDQVSFPYVLWKHPDVQIATITGANARDHPFFDYVSQY